MVKRRTGACLAICVLVVAGMSVAWTSDPSIGPGPSKLAWAAATPLATSVSETATASPQPSPTTPVDDMLFLQREMYQATVKRIESNFTLLLAVVSIAAAAMTFIGLLIGAASLPLIRRRVEAEIESSIRRKTGEELSEAIADLVAELRKKYEPRIVEMLDEWESTIKDGE